MQEPACVTVKVTSVDLTVKVSALCVVWIFVMHIKFLLKRLIFTYEDSEVHSWSTQ